MGDGAGRARSDPRNNFAKAQLARVIGVAVVTLALGGFLGLVVAILTPAHLNVVGSDATVGLHLGRSDDELALNGNTLNAKRATARSILGEPIGLSVRLELDPSAIVAPDGSFNPDIIPAYVQAFSDPQQLATDLRWAVTKHAIVGTVVGAALALTLYLLELWRRRRQRGQLRRLAPTYRLPVVEIRARERVNRRRAGMCVAVALTLAFVPSADRHVTIRSWRSWMTQPRGRPPSATAVAR